jgi:hypothetical protein
LFFFLFEGCGYFAFYFCFAACWFGEYFAADVAGDFVYGVAVEELFVSTFLAFDAEEAAFGFGDEFIPFCRVFRLRVRLL